MTDLLTAVSEYLAAVDRNEAEARRAEQPGERPWSSAPMVHMISKLDALRKRHKECRAVEPNALRSSMSQISQWISSGRLLDEIEDWALFTENVMLIHHDLTRLQNTAGLRLGIQEAIDLLLEKTQGSPARSAAHNARVRLQSLLDAEQPA